MITYGSMDSAMQFAEAKHFEYTDARYANQNPCTTVYRLVRQLLGKDEILNVEIMSSVEIVRNRRQNSIMIDKILHTFHPIEQCASFSENM